MFSFCIINKVCIKFLEKCLNKFYLNFFFFLIMGKKKIPDRWLDYKAIGSVVGEIFVPFKVPLHQRITISDKKQHTTKDIIEAFPNLGLVIDLTNTTNRTRYYEPVDWKSKGIKYQWIQVKGHATPSQQILIQFCKVVKKFLNQNPKKLIGVHCTHGINRTGYFICSYMVLIQRIPARIALKAFADARGYEIERKNYIHSIISHDKNEELKKLVNPGKRNIESNEEESSNKKIILNDHYKDQHTPEDLNTEIMNLTENEVEQEKLKNCMDISGISQELLNSPMPLIDIVTEILNDHKISHEKSSIVDVQKISDILVVTFKSYEEKLRILKLKRDFHKKKRFKICFNHTLTPTNSLLLTQARILCTKLKLRANVTHGKIYVNNLTSTGGVRIRSFSDLNQIEKNGGISFKSKECPSTSS